MRQVAGIGQRVAPLGIRFYSVRLAFTTILLWYTPSLKSPQVIRTRPDGPSVLYSASTCWEERLVGTWRRIVLTWKVNAQPLPCTRTMSPFFSSESRSKTPSPLDQVCPAKTALPGCPGFAPSFHQDASVGLFGTRCLPSLSIPSADTCVSTLISAIDSEVGTQPWPAGADAVLVAVGYGDELD